MLLTDGIPANTGGRYEDNVIAKYEFKTGRQHCLRYQRRRADLTPHTGGDVNWVGVGVSRLSTAKPKVPPPPVETEQSDQSYRRIHD